MLVSTADLRCMFDQLAVAIALFNADQRLVLCNQKFADLWEITPEQQATQPTWHTLVSAFSAHSSHPHAPLPEFDQSLADLAASGALLRLPQPESRCLEITCKPTPSGYILLTAQLIDLDWQAWQDTLQRLTFHVENSPVGVVEWNTKLRVTRWSREAENIFGWRAEEVLGKRPGGDWKFLYEEDRVATLRRVVELFSGQHQRNVNYSRHYCKDGSVRHCEWYNSVLFDRAGKVVSILSLVLDVTERKQAEELLKQQSQRSQLLAETTLKIRQSLQLSTILQTTVDEVRHLLQADRVLIYQVFADGSGQVSTEAVVSGVASLLNQTFPAETFSASSQIYFQQGNVQVIEDVATANLSASHATFLTDLGIQAQLVVSLQQGHRLWGLMLIHQCRAGRHWSELEIDLLQQLANQVSIALAQAQLLEAQRESEERFHQLTENIQGIFWIRQTNPERVIYVSPAYEQIWGCSCETLYQDPDTWMARIHPDDRRYVLASLDKQLVGQFDQEYRILRPNGEIRWIRDRAFPIKDSSGQVYRITGLAEDITERKQQEERLRLLESVVVNANDSVVITSAEPINRPGPNILYVNEAFTRMTGWQAEEVIGKNPRILQGPKTDRPTLNRIRQALESRQPIVVELLNYRKDRSEFWVELSIVPVLNRNGQYTHWVAIQREVTHRKQLEAELIKTLEKERELNELKSRFVTMASHEFRTPLSTILSASELLEYYGHSWPRDEQLEQLHLIQDTVQHMTDLLEDILILGRIQSERLEFTPTDLDLPRFCSDLVTQIQASIGREHVIQFHCSETTAIAQVDEKLLRQILSNLLSNAVKYSPIGSRIDFDLQRDPNQWVFQIRDRGIGIPATDLPHLFAAFFRAKNVGSTPGTGLGLAIVKHCVDAHNGRITVASEIGIGATFRITLPRLDHQSA